MSVALPLSRSLTHLDRLLVRARPGFVGAVAQALGGRDPYFVDLPGYQGGIGGRIQPETLQIIAALYFAAEIEGTYLMSVGEELASARFTLNLTDREAALRLEQLATAMQDAWVTRELRNQIFARVFGVGYADPNLGDTAVNREFEPRMARFCAALLAVSAQAAYPPQTSSAVRAGVAAQSLLANLSSKMQGNTLIVAERLSKQLRTTLAAINHPGLALLFRGANAWDVVRAVLGTDTPDLASHINRAQTGLRILGWIADHLPAFQQTGGADIASAVNAEPQLTGWADLWLISSGLDHAPQQQGYGGHGALRQPGRPQ